MRTMDNDSGVIRTVAWPEVFPWLIIFRTFRLAVSFRVLAMAAVAALLMATIWGLLGRVFGTDSAASAWIAPYRACSWTALTGAVPNQPALVPVPVVAPVAVPQAPITENGLPVATVATSIVGVQRSGVDPFWSSNPVAQTWMVIAQPVLAMFSPDTGVRELACLLLCALSSLAIWSFFGAAITRIAAVQLTTDERLSTMAALRFACSKWLSFFVGPLLPALGVVFALIPVWILGLLLRTGFTSVVAGLLYPVALLLGLVAALLMVGILFGWPLMWPTISSEGTDAFDALSRSFAYLFQHPLRYLFYAVVAALLGWLGWIFVQNFAAGIVWITYWAAGWGGGSERLAQILSGTEATGLAHLGGLLVRFWAGCVKLLAVGYLYGFFWSAAVAVYLLLRRDVDATEMDEVFLDADTSEPAEGLPPIATDEAGAPVVVEPAGPLPSAPAPGAVAPPGAGLEGGAAAPRSSEDKFGHSTREPNGEN
ncbi:MAG: hypothetical protein ACOY3P_15225 [Planctomycetota bacterium]